MVPCAFGLMKDYLEAILDPRLHWGKDFPLRSRIQPEARSDQDDFHK